MKSVLLVGGGIDSMTLLVWLRKVYKEDLVALHVNYGQKAWEGEKQAVDYFCEKYGVGIQRMKMELDGVSSAILKGTKVGVEQWENKLEGRNVTLISLAATYASVLGGKDQRGSKVFVGFHKEPASAPFPDATKATLQAMEQVLKTSYTTQVRLRAPFGWYERLEIFRLGMALDSEIATKTFSCYEEGLKECGVCVHCKLKTEMLEKL